LLPYSRMKTTPGNTFAVGKVRTLGLHKKYFHELEQLNPELIQRLIGYMTERARSFATTQLQHEKVNALGQLSAGIAHELNNPAAAINRIACELSKKLELNYDLTEKLLVNKINHEHIQRFHNMVRKKESEKGLGMSALQKIEMEDEITGWLEKNKFRENRISLETFIDSGFSKKDFDDILVSIGNESFIQALMWLENLISSQKLLKDLGDASSRISNLVGAIKSHVHMDRTNELQPTNIHKDIDNTLTLLGHKLRDKNISVIKNYCENMREIPVYVGELNQVWTNVIDNAVFALNKSGEIKIETSCNDWDVTVRIIDNGPGIPKEIVSRIFDPFFTTKKVGQGTGIGLDLVNRIVKRHNGEIKVNSVPGRTEFIICIPVSQKK
jgi:signal transduction histidine kinase